jgi:glycosyltransferase involved in cell wall biosynthesis
MLGRIVELKNPHLLVEALSAHMDLPWTLDIFGDGPDRTRLEALAPSSDRVRWRGASPGPDHAFAEIDVLCVPSRTEAFPMVIAEAMTRGVPVVASAVGSIPDILDGGRAGILVEPVTVEAWSAALRPILVDPSPLAELAKAGVQRANEQYTVDAMTDAYEAAIAL